MKNKKGVSPLIATVMLVAFAIALAAIVSSFILNKVRSFDAEKLAESSIYCDSVTLSYDVPKPDDLKADSPAGGGRVLEGIDLINRGSFTIHKLIISAAGTASREEPIVINGAVTTLKPGATGNRYPIKIFFKPTATDKQIKIIPVIQDPEKKTFVQCIDRQLIFADYCQIWKDVKGSTAPCPGV
jgi:flagellin-like protein